MPRLPVERAAVVIAVLDGAQATRFFKRNATLYDKETHVSAQVIRLEFVLGGESVRAPIQIQPVEKRILFDIMPCLTGGNHSSQSPLAVGQTAMPSSLSVSTFNQRGCSINQASSTLPN
jgi:hypothetical protein